MQAANLGKAPQPKRQNGITLVELMVGVAIGLMVVAVAGGALMVSRSTSGTVSDASQLQQQAGYAFRVIGQQLRQSGSLYLNLNATKNASTDIDRYALPVAFEAKATSSDPDRNFSPATDTINGTDTTLTVGYRRYKEPVYPISDTSPATQSLSRDCQGGPQDLDTADNNSFMRISSAFALNTNNLVCTGTSGTTQPVIGNVANFRIRYLRMTDIASGAPKIQYVNAAGVGTNWGQVTGVEVCLVLYGTERMNLPSTSSYTDCDGTTVVGYTSADATDMSGNAIGADRAQRLHMVFRSVYQLRSQGLIGNVL
ncbi:PilW family protein [Comamonas koreensis]|uniref:PilW family protein n=1 Tax=Comamonas koreensis TaxID=160825 RepID=A0AAW4XZI4_9BURK|nr:PilW family protein [Comamonas koreensis]MCD2167079.1 PilW family protein [Comamonas koreensis]